MGTLETKVTADIVDLQAKFAVAKAEYAALQSQMRQLASESAKGLLDPAGEAQLRAVAEEFLHAKETARQFQEEINRTKDSTASVGSALEEIRGKISTAFDVTGVTAAIGAITFVTEKITELGERATQMRTMAEVLQVSTDEFQAMQVAADRAGVPIETFERAQTRLIALLEQARDGSGAARVKLEAMGISLNQIRDPAFNINQLLQVLHDRLNDATTASQTMTAIVVELGARGALSAEAIKNYDGSFQAVKKTTEEVNALSKEQIDRLHDMATGWKEIVTWTENAGSKALAWAGDFASAMDKAVSAAIKAHPILATALGGAFGGATGATVAAVASSGGGTGASEKAAKDAAQAASAAKAALDPIAAAQDQLTEKDLLSLKTAIEAYKQGTAERLQAVTDYAQAAASVYGEDSKEAQAAQGQLLAAQREYSQAAEEEINHREQLQHSFDMTLTREQEELSRELSHKFKEETTDREKQFDEQQRAHAAYMKRVERDQDEMNRELVRSMDATQKDFARISDGLGGAFSRAFDGMLSRGQTFTQSMRNLFMGMGESIISTLAKIAMQYVINAAISKATGQAAAKSNILAHAAEAASGAMASAAAIPYIGWILAPIEGAAIYAAALAFPSMDVGAWSLPRDMVVQAHEGETIMPKTFAEGFRENAGGGMGGGGEHHNYYGDMHLTGSNDLLKQLANPRSARGAIAALGAAVRRGAR